MGKEKKNGSRDNDRTKKAEESKNSNIKHGALWSFS